MILGRFRPGSDGKPRFDYGAGFTQLGLWSGSASPRQADRLVSGVQHAVTPRKYLALAGCVLKHRNKHNISRVYYCTCVRLV